jgi:ACS family hexuronate transporter-like MFS transporter
MSHKNGEMVVASTEKFRLRTSAIATFFGQYRWLMCILLFGATTFSLIDRQTISILKPVLSFELHWNAMDYANIVLAYQIGQLFLFGIILSVIIDLIGARWGYFIAVAIWTVAYIACGFAGSLLGFLILLFVMGVGQGGNFPAAVKVVAEWFPQRERALATGIFNAGIGVGMFAAPLLVLVVANALGWRMTFVVIGGLGLIWLILWFVLYRRPQECPKMSSEESACLENDKQTREKSVPWWIGLNWWVALRATLAFSVGKFLTDWVWWLLLFWLPVFISREYDVGVNAFAKPLRLILLMALLGSVAGGGISYAFAVNGTSANAARKWTMLICALCALPVMFTMHIGSWWASVAIISVTAAAYQGFSTNLFTLPSDMLPKQIVSTVVGIGSTAGVIGGILMAMNIGKVLQYTGGNYTPIFVTAGVACLLALGIIHLLTPKLTPARAFG